MMSRDISATTITTPIRCSNRTSRGGAPAGLIFTIECKLEKGSWLDYGMFLQTLMLAARAKGLHTCAEASIAS